MCSQSANHRVGSTSAYTTMRPFHTVVDHAVERTGDDDVGVDVDHDLRLAEHAGLRLEQPRMPR